MRARGVFQDEDKPVGVSCDLVLNRKLHSSSARGVVPEAFGMSVNSVAFSRGAARLHGPGPNQGLVCPVQSPETRKPSAVERLEADKAKYVKSQQVALKKQHPVTSPSGPTAPTRRMPAPRNTPELDLQNLYRLIRGVSQTASPAARPGHTQDPAASSQPNLPKPLQTWTRRDKDGVDAAEVSGRPTVTVRRVDVRPSSGGPALQNQESPRVPVPHLLRPYARQDQPAFRRFNVAQEFRKYSEGEGPCGGALDSVPALTLGSSPPGPVSYPVTSRTPDALQSPPSPAVTHSSSPSTKKRPSLTRSKSDTSDCVSRPGVDLERFFNYCGLDPSDLEELAGPGSDIVSVSRLHSASAPASEQMGEEAEEEESERSGAGVSVIERNARVIKWLYGMRQAKESPRLAL